MTLEQKIFRPKNNLIFKRKDRMNLQEFTTEAISSIVQAIKIADGTSDREVKLSKLETSRTIEFDIAVSATEKSEGDLHGGIKVLSIIDAGGKNSKEITNSTVSRIHFGVNVNEYTKDQINQHKAREAANIEMSKQNNRINQAR